MTDRVPASELRWQRFPICTKHCKELLAAGPGYCVSTCPHKFRTTPNKPYAFEDVSQDDLDRQRLRERGS